MESWVCLTHHFGSTLRETVGAEDFMKYLRWLCDARPETRRALTTIAEAGGELGEEKQETQPQKGEEKDTPVLSPEEGQQKKGD